MRTGCASQGKMAQLVSQRSAFEKVTSSLMAKIIGYSYYLKTIKLKLPSGKQQSGQKRVPLQRGQSGPGGSVGKTTRHLAMGGMTWCKCRSRLSQAITYFHSDGIASRLPRFGRLVPMLRSCDSSKYSSYMLALTHSPSFTLILVRPGFVLERLKQPNRQSSTLHLGRYIMRRGFQEINSPKETGILCWNTGRPTSNP